MPQSGAKKKKNQPSDELAQTQKRAELAGGSLTAVGLVGLVGTVLDAVTLRVDLGDAGGGAALEVSTAVGRWKVWRRQRAAGGQKCKSDAPVSTAVRLPGGTGEDAASVSGGLAMEA